MSGLGSVLLGGLGQSTNPADYSVNSPNQAQMQQMMAQQAAQAQAADPAAQAQWRQMQFNQAQQLARMANGQQQGAGELAVQRQVQNALAAQQAATRNVRGGGNAGLGLLAGARNAAGVGLSGAGQGQQAASQDQWNAMGALSGALGQGRQQDLGLMGTQQQNNQFNAQAQNERYGQNLNALSANDAQRMQAQQAAMGSTLGQQGLLGGLISAGGQLGGAAILHSDENLKTGITDARDDIDDMLSRLQAKSYEYKDQKHGAGRRAGIMAQDLERSKIGKMIVFEAPDGKALDQNKTISALLASAARLDERLRKVEHKAA